MQSLHNMLEDLLEEYGEVKLSRVDGGNDVAGFAVECGFDGEERTFNRGLWKAVYDAHEKILT